MKLIDFDESYLEQAVKLAAWEFSEESKEAAALQRVPIMELLPEIVHSVFQKGIGKIALNEAGELIGFLGFFGPWDGFFGRVKGAFSPLGASAFGGSNRAKTASMLYAEVATELMKREAFSMALSRYAHDEEVGRSFVLNGFGIRCSDAAAVITKDGLKNGDTALLSFQEQSVQIPDNMEIQEFHGEERYQIEPLRRALTLHMAEGPIFFPTDNGRTDLSWYENENLRIFAALQKGTGAMEVMGYLAIDTEGETFFTQESYMRNICGAYVIKKYRGGTVASALLAHLGRILYSEGCEILGVDCETLNPTALHFWGKHFAPYTYSYARRLDERIYGYEEYLKECWKEVDSK